MNLKEMNDRDLHQNLVKSVETEKQLVTQILYFLKEVNDRKLYCDFQCKSLFDYAIKILKYSEAEAVIRINAMRLLAEIPEIEEEIQKGHLTLTNVSQAQSFFRKEEKKQNRSNGILQNNNPSHLPSPSASLKPQKLSIESKKDILNQLKNQPTRKAKSILQKLAGDSEAPQESIRRKGDRVELNFSVTEDVFKKLEMLKNKYRLQNKQPTLEFIIEKLCTSELTNQSFPSNEKKLHKRSHLNNQPVQSIESMNAVPSTRAHQKPRVNNKTLTPAMRYYIKKRDQHCCQNCGSGFNLQVDHIKPQALGGTHHPNNLQTLCQPCNLRRAIKTFGIAKMQNHLK